VACFFWLVFIKKTDQPACPFTTFGRPVEKPGKTPEAVEKTLDEDIGKDEIGHIKATLGKLDDPDDKDQTTGES